MSEINLPKRKKIRMENFDYSTASAYFITICTADRRPILWNDFENCVHNVGADIIRPNKLPLSSIGKLVDDAIKQISEHYDNVTVDKYCIMSDHIHLLIFILSDGDGRQIAAPTIPRVIGQMKRWVSKTAGFSVWQKSFIDRVIRNEKGYRAAWNYIENNPYKIDFGDDDIDFSQF